MLKKIEEIEEMMDVAIEQNGHREKFRNTGSKHINSGVRLRLALVEVDDAESNSMVKGI